jgi:Putative Flp pilus-assembly TadE/G-like
VKARKGQRGQALPLLGLAMMMVMGIGAATVDLAYAEYTQQRMQVAADAAAIAGAQTLITNGCPDPAAAQPAAVANATTQGFTTGGSVTVTVDNPPTAADGPYQGNNCAVYVKVASTSSASWFFAAMGRPLGIDLSAVAVAQMETTNNSCVAQLNPQGTANFSGGDLNAPNCSVYVNASAANLTGSTINVKTFGYSGAIASAGATFSGGIPTAALPTQDLCPEIAACANVTANLPAASGCTSLAANNPAGTTISPGCYNDLNLTNTPVLFNPGTYVLNGTSEFSGASLDAREGVLFYVTCNGIAPNFAAAAGGELNPQLSGPQQGVLYYQAPCNATTPVFGSGGCNNSGNGVVNTNGIIYAPGANNVIVGALSPGSNNATFIVGGITLASGHGQTCSVTNIPSAPSVIGRVVLVQ